MSRRPRVLLLLCCVVAVFLVGADSVTATPVYSQTSPDEPVGAFSSRDAPGSQKIADNFILEGTEPISIRSVSFIGGYGRTPVDELPTDAFRIVFLSDEQGSPGEPISGGDFATATPVNRIPTGGRLLNGTTAPIQHVIDFGDGISLSPATVYWISITNDPGPNHGWQWARADGIFDTLLASTTGDAMTGPWVVGPSSGMFFELNNHNVPEPSSLAILIGLLGTLLGRIQNRSYR